jgi:hypothetical protein
LKGAQLAEIDRVKGLLDEAKLRVRDLTRELDESMRAESEEVVTAELLCARERVVALDHSLERLNGRK